MTEVFASISAVSVDLSALETFVLTSHDGALASFRGIVRDHDGDRAVTSLEYEAHPDAERFLAAACAQIAEETGLRVAASHRTGRLVVGDLALGAAVASAHRAEAFDALARLVDLIKQTVPIWKRQHFLDGASEWVGL